MEPSVTVSSLETTVSTGKNAPKNALSHTSGLLDTAKPSYMEHLALSETTSTNSIKVWDVWFVEVIQILLQITKMISTMTQEFCVLPHKPWTTSSVSAITAICKRDRFPRKPKKPTKDVRLLIFLNWPSLVLPSPKEIRPLIQPISMRWLEPTGMTQ